MSGSFREKQTPPSLSPQKHPHGTSPGRETHPHCGQPRPYAYGNDNSSVNRQSRVQSTRPDPIPGTALKGSSEQITQEHLLSLRAGPIYLSDNLSWILSLMLIGLFLMIQSNSCGINSQSRAEKLENTGKVSRNTD